MARRDAGTDRLARLSPAKSLQNQKRLPAALYRTADNFYCRPRREGWGLQTLARCRILGDGGGHFSGEFLDSDEGAQDLSGPPGQVLNTSLLWRIQLPAVQDKQSA